MLQWTEHSFSSAHVRTNYGIATPSICIPYCKREVMPTFPDSREPTRKPGMASECLTEIKRHFRQNPTMDCAEIEQISAEGIRTLCRVRCAPAA